ncbi:hypothetical protein SEUCBS140593_009873 [Sporothrix eucalyptigena]|uniref:Uncharacterized protein n=1 Tax=Sporothrix eucalyptigena TaxID=1812306 RepID=A0ABP0D1S4_9PEZI
MDLGKRMTKILEIDPDRGYKHLWIDVPDLGGGSALGNTVDRGVGYTPYGNHYGCHYGMEVVLPTGEVIRNGMGAFPGNNSWQVFPDGFGPYVDGIFTQSNFGIVTKIEMTLMPNPGGSDGFMCTFKEEEDLAQIVSALSPAAAQKSSDKLT